MPAKEAELAQLQDEGDRWSESIERKRAEIRGLDDKIGLNTSRIMEQISHQGGNRALKANTRTLNSAVRVLENRIEQASVFDDEVTDDAPPPILAEEDRLVKQTTLRCAKERKLNVGFV